MDGCVEVVRVGWMYRLLFEVKRPMMFDTLFCFIRFVGFGSI